MIKKDELEKEYREITIRLWGTPLAKQSVKFGKFGAYTDKKHVDKAKDYKEQIIKQLPNDFKMFTKEVIILHSKIVFPPLKGFSKKKVKSIEDGEVIPKVTRPDLLDNLHKLPIDCMSELVFKDDSLIWKVEGTIEKVYGIEGYTEIRMKGI